MIQTIGNNPARLNEASNHWFDLPPHGPDPPSRNAPFASAVNAFWYRRDHESMAAKAMHEPIALRHAAVRKEEM